MHYNAIFCNTILHQGAIPRAEVRQASSVRDSPFWRIGIGDLTPKSKTIIMIVMPKLSAPKPVSKLTELRLTAAVAEKRIRQIALVTENVILGTHALERMAEREIFDVDVFRALRLGYVDEPPEQPAQNEWKCKVTLKIRGRRTAGVVTIILQNAKLSVKTVEWEDVS